VIRTQTRVVIGKEKKAGADDYKRKNKNWGVTDCETLGRIGQRG
jgi:hypothetical protein